MKSSLDIMTLLNSIKRFFSRYDGMLFFIIMAGFIAFTILSVIAIINDSSRTDSSNVETIQSSFNQTTIDRLRQLENGTGSSQPAAGSRTNPFAE